MTNRILFTLAALVLIGGLSVWFLTRTQHRSNDQKILLRKAQ